MSKDARDTLSWVTIELAPLGEQKVQEGTLAKLIRHHLEVDQDFQVFIPSARIERNGKNLTVSLMEGYVFVQTGLPESQYLSLNNRAYVSRVLTTPTRKGVRVIQTIPDQHICDLRSKLNALLTTDVVSDTWVRVLGGTYQNLEGRVLSVEEEYVIVLISLRSLEVITRLPKVQVSFDEQEEA